MLLKQLHWTHLNNRFVKYERLNNVAVQQLVQNSKTKEIYSLRRALMMLRTPAGHPLFVGVEAEKQGQY